MAVDKKTALTSPIFSHIINNSLEFPENIVYNTKDKKGGDKSVKCKWSNRKIWKESII